MSEVMESGTAAAVAEGGAGRLLREAREAAGLHVAALAVSLKVPVRKLEALEAERFEEVGEPVFVRGLAGSVCRALKVPAQPVLERLPQGAQPRLVADSEGINTPFRSAADGAPPTWLAQLTRPVVLAVAALLLGAGVLLLLPLAQHADDKATVAPPVAPPAAPQAADAPRPGTTAPVAQAPGATPAPASSAAALAGSAAGEPAARQEAPEAARPKAASPEVAPAPAGASSAAAAPLPAAAPVPAAVAPAPAAVGAQAASAAVASAGVPAAGGLLSFKASGATWIEVSEAGGTVVLRRLLGAGESVSASGKPPLKVTVGKADLTQVEVRGRAFDLQPYSRDNVARFEVK